MFKYTDGSPLSATLAERSKINLDLRYLSISGPFYTGLGTFIICSKTVVGQCVLAIQVPTIIAGSWFTGGQ